jgi:nucleoside transporter
MHIMGAVIMYGTTVLMKATAPSPDLINLGPLRIHVDLLSHARPDQYARHEKHDESGKRVSRIRVFGTIGWIVAGLALSWVGWDKSIAMFHLTAGAALFLGLYSFTLPDTPPVSTGPVSARQILGLDALVLLKNRSYLIFVISSLLICIPLAFYYQITSRIVEMSDLPIGQTMSYGQMSEIFFMLVMPFFFLRLGVKWMLAVGMLAWVARYALFAMGAPAGIRWMIILGIVLHGICYDFFFVTGQIYTDRVAPPAIRAQAQGLLVLFTLGLGMAIGAKVAGQIEAQHTTAESRAFADQVVARTAEIDRLVASGVNDAASTAKLAQLQQEKTALRREELKAIEWGPLWGKPAIFAGIILILFLLLFKDRAAAAVKQESSFVKGGAV